MVPSRSARGVVFSHWNPVFLDNLPDHRVQAVPWEPGQVLAIQHTQTLLGASLPHPQEDHRPSGCPAVWTTLLFPSHSRKPVVMAPFYR